jgi:C4-dicarboxylate-specific signal transduction histidine kinase
VARAETPPESPSTQDGLPVSDPRLEGWLRGRNQLLEMVARSAPLAAILKTNVEIVAEQFGLGQGSVAIEMEGAASAERGASRADLGSTGRVRSWTWPIEAADGAPLGEFVIYGREPRQPSAAEREVIGVASKIAGVAIERARLAEAIQTAQAALEARVEERTQALIAVNAQFRALLDAMPDLLLRIDRRGVLLEVKAGKESPPIMQASESTGLPLERALPGDLAARCRRGLESALLRGDGEFFEYEAGHDGGMRSCEVRMVPAGADEVLAIIRDISDRRRAEERERNLQTELAHVTRLSTMGEMASGLAHELNQPLSAIVAFVAGCRRRLESGEAASAELLQAMRSAEQEAQRAGAIIHRLRSFVSRKEPRQSSVHVNDVVGEVAALFSGELRLAEVELAVELAGDLPLVLTDRVQIAQVLINLLRNAVEAIAGEGASGRSVRVWTAYRDGGMIEIGVEDSGPGIRPEVAGRMFDPFFTTKPHGMGMGLAISRTIVQAHGGSISAEPRPDRAGTRLRFTLPGAGISGAAASGGPQE